MTAKEFSVSKFISEHPIYIGHNYSTFECVAIATNGKKYKFVKAVRKLVSGVVQSINYSNIQESE